MDECRLCLKKAGQSRSRVEFYHINNSMDPVFQGIKEIFDFDITLNPLMILTICISCKDHITLFYAFYREVKVNLDKLKALINPGPVSVEPNIVYEEPQEGMVKYDHSYESPVVEESYPVEEPEAVEEAYAVEEPETVEESHKFVPSPSQLLDQSPEVDDTLPVECEEEHIGIYEDEGCDTDDYKEIEILELEDEEENEAVVYEDDPPYKEIVTFEDQSALEHKIEKLKSKSSLTLYEQRKLFYEFNCFKCGKEFSEEPDLESHQKSRHNLKHVTYFCCLKERKVENANDHMRMHVCGGKFTCYACGKTYSMIRRLRIHQNDQCDQSGTCPDCNEYLPAKELYQHFTKHSRESKKSAKEPSNKKKPTVVVQISNPTQNNPFKASGKELETITERTNLVRANPHLTLYEKRKIFYTFNCYKCKENFNEEEELEKHQQTDHGLKKITYFCCNKQRMEESSNDHILYHVDPNQFCCYACGKKFSMTRRLRIHQIHDCNKSGHCLTCKNYLPAKELFKHRLQHMKEQKKFTKETITSDIVPDKTKRSHVKTTEPEPQVFECDLCKKRFRRYDTLKSHITQIHLKAHRQVCSLCGFSSRYSSSLENHIRTQHHNTEKQQCTVCGKYVKQLKIHIQMHHTVEDEPSNCEICGKTFNNLPRLKMHIKGAHGGKRYRCDQCGKQFRHKNYLNEHVHAHLGPDVGYLYKCNYCSHQSNYKHNLSTHVLKHHPREWEEQTKARLHGLYGDDLVPKTLEGNQETSLKNVFDESGLKFGKKL